MLLVQTYLLTHTFADLERDHGVYCSFDKTFRKFSLNYSILEAKEDDPLANQCRGLILACSDGRSLLPADHQDAPAMLHKSILQIVCPRETVVVCRGLDRFLNYGQGAANHIDFSDPKLAIKEKLDGSLIMIGKCLITNQWFAATRSVPEADRLMDNGIYTFRTLFEKALQETIHLSWEQFTQQLDAHLTYCFELTSPLNTIVVQYPDYRITLLAARDLRTMKELDINLTQFDLFPRPKTYFLANIQQVLDYVCSQSPKDHEGVVVMDGQFRRIKVKNSAYVLMHKCRDSFAVSLRNCLELILREKEDDVIPYMPQEIVEKLLSIKDKYKKWLLNQQEQYQAVYQKAIDRFHNSSNDPNETNQKKEFALTLDKYPNAYRPAFFNVFSQKASNIKDFIDRSQKNGMWSDSLLDTLLIQIGV